MARKPTPARTIHYREVAASLEAQNRAVMMLLQSVRTLLDLSGDKIPAAAADIVREHATAVQRAMWPDAEGED